MKITRQQLRQIIQEALLLEVTDEQRQILRAMHIDGAREVSTIAWVTMLTPSRVRRGLAQLEKLGKVTKRARPATLSRRVPDEWHLVESLNLSEGALPRIVEDVLAVLSEKWRDLWKRARSQGIESLPTRDRLLLVSALEEAAERAGYSTPKMQAHAVDAALAFVTPW